MINRPMFTIKPANDEMEFYLIQMSQEFFAYLHAIKQQQASTLQKGVPDERPPTI